MKIDRCKSNELHMNAVRSLRNN